jgi:hypothetical protein
MGGWNTEEFNASRGYNSLMLVYFPVGMCTGRATADDPQSLETPTFWASGLLEGNPGFGRSQGFLGRSDLAHGRAFKQACY